MNLKTTTIKCSALSTYKCDYDVSLYQKGDSSEPYEKVFTSFAQKYTGAIKRNDWKRLENYTPTKNDEFMYLFSKNGEPKAFLGFAAKKASNLEDWHFNMQAKDIAWTDAQSLHNILGFIGSLQSHYQECILTLPDSLPVDRIVDEGNPIKVERYTCGQVRIVDVHKALENYQWPTDSAGSLIIKVTDDHFVDNNGVFTISFGSQGATVTRTDANPDVEMHVRVLNALLMQTIDFKNLCYIKQQEYTVFRNRETLEKVFVLGDNFVTEFY